MMKASHALLVAFALPILSHAQSMSRDVKVSGMGVRLCSEWMQWKETQNGEARALAVEWAQGFISGHNIYNASNPGANSVVADAKVLLPLIDSNCQRNPDIRLLSVVVDITRSLGGRRINIAPKSPAQNPQRGNNVEPSS